MERDSNPRDSSSTAFQVPRLRPLGHPSIIKSHKIKGNKTTPTENNIVTKKYGIGEALLIATTSKKCPRISIINSKTIEIAILKILPLLRKVLKFFLFKIVRTKAINGIKGVTNPW